MAVGLLAQARSPPFLPCLFPPFLIPSLPSSLFPLPSSLPPFFFLFSFFLPSLYTLFIKQIGFKNHLHTNNGDFKDKYYMIHPDFFFFWINFCHAGQRYVIWLSVRAPGAQGRNMGKAEIAPDMVTRFSPLCLSFLPRPTCVWRVKRNRPTQASFITCILYPAASLQSPKEGFCF